MTLAPPQAEHVAVKIQEAIHANPNSLALQFPLANLRLLQGHYEEAEKILRAIHEKNPSLGTPLNNLAWLLALQDGRGSEALSLAQQAIDLDGETPGLLDTRAVAYLATGQADLAIKDLEDSIAVQPLPDIYFHLARAYLAKGRQGDAGKALQRAHELGFTEQKLSPLERKSYQQLLSALAKN